MADTKLEPVDLPPNSFNALIEHLRRSREQVMANIADASTKATAKRTTIIKIVYKPESDRRGMNIHVSAETKLVAASTHTSRGYAGKGTDGKIYLYGSDPRQEVLFDPPAVTDNLLGFKTGS